MFEISKYFYDKCNHYFNLLTKKLKNWCLQLEIEVWILHIIFLFFCFLLILAVSIAGCKTFYEMYLFHNAVLLNKELAITAAEMEGRGGEDVAIADNAAPHLSYFMELLQRQFLQKDALSRILQEMEAHDQSQISLHHIVHAITFRPLWRRLLDNFLHFCTHTFSTFQDIFGIILETVETVGTILLLWQFVSVNAMVFEQNQKHKQRDYETTCIITWNIFRRDPDNKEKHTCLMPSEHTFDIAQYFKDDIVLFDSILKAIEDRSTIDRVNELNRKFAQDKGLDKVVEIPDYIVTLNPYQFLYDDTVFVDITQDKDDEYLTPEDKLQLKRDEDEFHRRIRNYISEAIKSSQWPHFAHYNKDPSRGEFEDALYMITCERNVEVKLTRIWLIFPSELELLLSMDFSDDEKVKEYFNVHHERWVQKLRNLQKWAQLEFHPPAHYQSNSVLMPFYHKRKAVVPPVSQRRSGSIRPPFSSDAPATHPTGLVHHNAVDRPSYIIPEEGDERNDDAYNEGLNHSGTFSKGTPSTQEYIDEDSDEGNYVSNHQVQCEFLPLN